MGVAGLNGFIRYEVVKDEEMLARDSNFKSTLIGDLPLDESVAFLIDWPNAIFSFLDNLSANTKLANRPSFPCFTLSELVSETKAMLAQLAGLPSTVILFDDGSAKPLKSVLKDADGNLVSNNLLFPFTEDVVANGDLLTPLPGTGERGRLLHSGTFPIRSYLMDMTPELCIEAGLVYRCDILQEADTMICRAVKELIGEGKTPVIVSADTDMHLVHTKAHVIAQATDVFSLTADTATVRTVRFMNYLFMSRVGKNGRSPNYKRPAGFMNLKLQAAVAAVVAGNDQSKTIVRGKRFLSPELTRHKQRPYEVIDRPTVHEGAQYKRPFITVFRSLTTCNWLDIVRAEGVEQALRDTLLLSGFDCPPQLTETRSLKTTEDLVNSLSPPLFALFGGGIEDCMLGDSPIRFHPTVCTLARNFVRVLSGEAPDCGRHIRLFQTPVLSYLGGAVDDNGATVDRASVVRDFAAAVGRVGGRFESFDDSAHDKNRLFSEDMPWAGSCSIARDAILGLIITSHLTGHAEVLGWIWDVLDYELRDTVDLLGWVMTVAFQADTMCASKEALTDSETKLVSAAVRRARPGMLEARDHLTNENKLTFALVEASFWGLDQVVHNVLQAMVVAVNAMRWQGYPDAVPQFNEVAAIVDAVVRTF
ncbi:hypothetical protein J8273_2270 [Carpediemonas membranifera]|uniref:Uncharacterized protein n=1 Tax=Carpediemonas membranifera TaxID=201153 RepID=A0A8J6E3R8_9EUKA|nr:hypothetical protein J8273_2270 [Carpediemonas membranifera]|eukprot:KAG9395921.1 hypothetical protein J8273_2270 [Carpediemonas membranifera]